VYKIWSIRQRKHTKYLLWS